ncbi:hypothetical protein NQ318_000929 [Aromia moschata]|uniref:Uncharacterized protein n=1 Tax=Aromia moschata TaxID=1265417 RepID=A0AAV8ZGF4_9CUCU|nr:hypothetical protein NQ318_000929 [Aromia moschata]
MNSNGVSQNQKTEYPTAKQEGKALPQIVTILIDVKHDFSHFDKYPKIIQTPHFLCFCHSTGRE